MSVLSFLNDTASSAVLSTSEKSSIATSISALQTRIGNYFASGAIKQHFRFGSSMRGTILPRAMDAHSDIDYMIVFSERNATPQTYLNRLKAFVDKYYRTSEIRQSSPTIVLELNHIKFDLVPATLDGYGGFQISYGFGGWMSTNPNDFNSTLEVANKANGFLIKPSIRLAKYWNARSGFPFDSFGLEKWICSLHFWGAFNQKEYLFSIFDSLSVDYWSAQWIKSEVKRAKKIVSSVREYERQEMPFSAEMEIKKLFRL